jgi:hypothetical protein
MLGDTGQEDLAALEIDKEQPIEPTELIMSTWKK